MVKKQTRRSTDDETVGMQFGQRVAIGIIIALLAQAGSSVWWASSLTTRVADHDQHLLTLDEFSKKTVDAIQQVSERMTRVEEQQKSAQQSLNRIENILATTPSGNANHGR